MRFDRLTQSRHKLPMAYRPAPIEVFDQNLIRQHLGRAHAAGGRNFLVPSLAEELVDRLNFIKRDFGSALDVGTPTNELAATLSIALPKATVTRFSAISDPQSDDKVRRIVVAKEEINAVKGLYDLVVSALAFQCVNDLPGLLAQIRRALQPDGLLIGCMLGGQTLKELRQAFTAAELDVSGGASPRIAPFADMRDVGALLQRAGFALPVTDSDVLTVRYGSPVELMRDLRSMGAANALVHRNKKPLRREILMRAIDIYHRDFSDSDGRIRATFEVIWFSGWVPHESQQKPLKPGSASVRLADVLPARNYDSTPQ